MVLVTLVGEQLAVEGEEFTYLGSNNECRNCQLKTVCFNLKPGRKYRITKLRDKHHDCNIHEGKVIVVEVEELPAPGVGSVLQRHEPVVAVADEPEDQRLGRDRLDRRRVFGVEPCDLLIGGFLRMDPRVGAGPEVGLVVQVIEDRPRGVLPRLGERLLQPPDELVLKDLPVAQIAPARFPRETIADIERAIVDRGYRYGARKCRITVERVLSAKRPTTRMKASIEYV